MSRKKANDLFEAVQLGEWRARLTAAVVCLFLFEAVSGLVIYFGPFSVTSQVLVLLHTGGGLAFLAPYVVYQLHHWRTNRERPFNQHKLLGYLSLGVMTVVAVSGVVLTVQAGWGRSISWAWDMVHLVGGLAATVFVVWHVALILVRHLLQGNGDKARRMRAAQGVFGRRVGVGLVALALVTVGWAMLTPTMRTEGSFPADYELPYGDDPFAPSLATTSTGTAVEADALAGSEACGTGNCHAEIVEEWEPSAHRWAAMSPFFQAVQATMAENNGPESTRYCGGCHDPIALFAGLKNLYTDDLSGPGAQEGVSCVACHSITRTDVRGNANYVLTPQPRYLWEDGGEGSISGWLGRFLIRAYPRQHLDSWSRDLYREPEFCGACHKQFIDEQINNVGWVQLQNQYDTWKQSRWHVPDDPSRTISCRECHMRLEESADPAAGDAADYNRTPDDGRHRSHRFIAANQYHPRLLDLPGADTQVRLTEEWLRGETVIPEIADKWTSGPTIPLEIVAPQMARAGERVRFQVTATNNKPGHDFPTGPLDIIQAWIAVEVRDQRGNLLFESGGLTDDHFLASDATVFKAEAVDQYGNLIDKHNLWEMVGARFKRTLFPGYSDVETYAFLCPDLAPGLAAKMEDAASGTAGNEPGAGDSSGELAAAAAGGSSGGPGEELGARETAAAAADADQEPPVPPTEGEVVPSAGVTELVVKARLRYRKVDQYLINYLFPDRGMTAPITDMSWAEARIRVLPDGS